jgi:hypothetical protein
METCVFFEVGTAFLSRIWEDLRYSVDLHLQMPMHIFSLCWHIGSLGGLYLCYLRTQILDCVASSIFTPLDKTKSDALVSS